MCSATLLNDWTRAPDADHVQRVKAMANEVRAALNRSESRLLQQAVVFLQGSSKNNTGTRNGTDIDIGVLPMFPAHRYAPTVAPESRGTTSFRTQYISFKTELDEALVANFGRARVCRRNKTLRITKVFERDHADITPFLSLCIEGARASLNNGVTLWPDDSERLIQNWPLQHYANGIIKNKRTVFRYKRFVRILKSLSAQMTVDGLGHDSIPGFLLECVTWNIPDQLLTKGDFLYGTQALLDHVLSCTEDAAGCSEWTEVNQSKLLFDIHQKWQCHDVHTFAIQAMNYLKLAL